MSAAITLASPPKASVSHLAAGAVGNMLEWYDFAAYGYFAAIFGRNFFPGTDAVASLAAAFGVFAAAFMMRPIGGALFGHIGDRFGRKRALMLSAVLMSFATVSIGLLPNYAAIGAAAPLLLILLRLLQGLSVGGEYATSVVYLVEQSSPRRRGLSGSVAAMGASLGTILGSGVGAITATLLDAQSLQAWGWRLPFLFGITLGIVAFILRRTMPDDEAPEAHSGQLPFVAAFRDDGRSMLRALALSASFAVTFYLVFVYLTTYMQQVDGLPAGRALQINTLSLLLALVLTPCFAMLSDHIGRKPVLLGATLGTTLLSYPLFMLLVHPDARLAQLGQCGFAVLVGAYGGTIPTTLVEMFKANTRCTALSISYNAAFALLGGTAPVVAVYLVGHERADLGPAFYLSAVAAISFVATLTLQERAHKPLM